MRIGLEDLIAPELAAYVEESREFNAATAASRDRSAEPDPSTPDGLEEARASLPFRPPPPGPPAVEELVEAAGRRVPVRILAPQSGQVRAVCLEIHGGGFYLGSAARGDTRNRRFAEALGVAVVSVEYRLAPEHRWPAAPDDCETAALWLLEQAHAHFGTSRLAIGGSSAGATLAMTTLLRLRERGLSRPFAGAVLQFGTYDLSGLTPAGRMLADEFFIRAYAGNVTDRTNPDISPIYGDLRELPPTLLVVGSRDIALEDNLAMAGRLSAAGCEVDLRVYPESEHGFTSFPTAMARAAVSDIDSWLAGRLTDHPGARSRIASTSSDFASVSG